MRRLRHRRARSRGRPPRLLRALRAPAPRPGVGRHRHVAERPHHGDARPGPRQPGLRRAEAARAAGRHGGRPRPLLARPAPTRGRTRSRSTAPTGARSRSPTTATSSTPSSCTTSCASEGVDVPLAPPTPRSSPRCSPRTRRTTVEDALVDVIAASRAPTRTVVMTEDRVVAFRDPLGPAAALARHARRPLLRRVRDLRVRHHRRQASCATSSRARSSRSPTTGSRRARRSPSPRRALCVFEHIYFARPDSRLGGQVLQVSRGRMGEILAREAPVDGRPRDPGAGLRQPGRARLRARVGPPAGRRPDQEPLRRAHLHPARPGAAQARPAAEVQPAARGRRRQAARRRRRLDRARQHDAPDRADAARRRRERGAHAHLRAADPPSLSLRDRHVDARGDDRPRPHARPRSPPSWAPTRSPTCRSRASTRRSAARARRTATPASPASYPLVGHVPPKDAFEHALPLRSRADAPLRRLCNDVCVEHAREPTGAGDKVASPCRSPWLEDPPAPTQTSLDLRRRRRPRPPVPVARVDRRRRRAARALRLRRLPAGPARGGRGGAAPAATCWS